MDILIISCVFPPEPVVSGQLSFDIANSLQSAGNNVTVICPPPSRPYGYDHSNIDNRILNFEVRILNSFIHPKSEFFGRLRESISFGKKCFSHIRQNHDKINVIYANTWPMFAQYYVIRASKKYNIPVVMHVQDIYPESLAEKKSAFLRRIIKTIFVPFDTHILKHSSRVVAISDFMKDYLLRTRGLNTGKVHVVRNWQNDQIFREQKRRTVKNQTFTFMYLGTINPTSNVETLINAFGRSDLAGTKLIIAGEGSSKLDCMGVAAEYPNAKISFIPAALEQVSAIQQEADILILPLKRGVSEMATPSKLIAYMFSGKPIIACVEESSDTAFCIQMADCGWITPPEDINLLSERLKKVIQVAEIDLVRLGENGYHYAIGNLSREKNLSRISDLILSVC